LILAAFVEATRASGTPDAVSMLWLLFDIPAKEARYSH
jgi:hypothetical protein